MPGVVLAEEDDLGQVFEIHLVDDAGARRHHAEVVERLLTPPQKFVPLAVAREFHVDVQVQRVGRVEVVDLHRVVDHQVDRHQRVDLLGVAAEPLHGGPHRRQVDYARHAGEILEHDAGRLERNLDLGRGGGVPTGQRLHVLFGHLVAVAVPQQRLEEHADRIGQGGDVAEPRVFKLREPVDAGGAAAGLKRVAGGKRIGLQLDGTHGWRPIWWLVGKRRMEFDRLPIQPSRFYRSIGRLGRSHGSAKIRMVISPAKTWTTAMWYCLRTLRRAFVLSSVFGIWLSAAALLADVVDEQGQPVTEFSAMANTADEGYTIWEKCANGQLPTFNGLQGTKAIDVFVRADGYAPNYVHLTEDLEPLRSLPARITLRHGTPIELRLSLPEGISWPDGFQPEVYFSALAERNDIMRQPSNRSRYAEGAPELDFGMNPKPLGHGKFELRLADDTPPFFVGVHKPGFLRFFDAGPFTLADVKDGVLEVKLPKPAVLHYSFCAPDDVELLPYNTVQFMLMRKLTRLGNAYLMADSQSKEAHELDVTIGDLAPGEYRASIHTSTKTGDEIAANDKPNPAVYYDTQTPKLKAGKTDEIEVVYSAPNPNSYRGDGTATIRVLAADGSPAGGKPITVAYIDSHYGAMPIHTDSVPDNGEITIADLTDRCPTDWPYGAYQVTSGDKVLGWFGFQPGEKATRAEFQLPPGVGDLAPEVKFSNLTNGSSASVSDFRGKVVWLEFWATWCGPCQKPIKDLAELAGEQRPEWKDKVALVPVSIDDDPSAVAKHFAERGWSGLTLYWTGVEGDPSRSSSQAPASRAFGVNGVPTAFLIDQKGRILWTGHPADTRDVKRFDERITAALE